MRKRKDTATAFFVWNLQRLIVGYSNLVESNYFYNNRKHVSNKKGPDADYCEFLINTDGRYVVLGLGDRKNLRNIFLCIIIY